MSLHPEGLHPVGRGFHLGGVGLHPGEGVSIQGEGSTSREKGDLSAGGLDRTPCQTGKAGGTHPTWMFPCYCPQQSCNIFAPVCHSVYRGGVCLSACWDKPPLEQTLPQSRHPREQTPPAPRADTPTPGADTPQNRQPPPEQTHPSGKQTPTYGQWAAGTHPTGMHSCFFLSFRTYQIHHAKFKFTIISLTCVLMVTMNDNQFVNAVNVWANMLCDVNEICWMRHFAAKFRQNMLFTINEFVKQSFIYMPFLKFL